MLKNGAMRSNTFLSSPQHGRPVDSAQGGEYLTTALKMSLIKVSTAYPSSVKYGSTVFAKIGTVFLRVPTEK